jgi:hypothetical protein
MRTGPALLVLFLVSFSPVCRAQSTNASLNGRVSDPSKAPIANAKLVAINTATDSHFETATNTAGRNVLRGFGATQADVALQRQFHFTEQVSLRFRSRDPLVEERVVVDRKDPN